ncbi:ventricular zone-expressed PH domain-containing protein isoform X1 [Cynoglossus semilaevis]|uniref:Ventricular zone expressed PH domain-containing 1 n=1 Tax=Cynoglossus semilaevis TaxID=244447 RepID=A0A3P8ULF9_CYNSE|nr:ventricular zone-expressed PH domain-containing protein homolog 1 isoform X1 [Cynoglossus semilaevis]
MMHQLFSQVLGHRDLSRAGDLFSLDDSEIEGCLSQALEQIKTISCSPDYLTNDNDQAVVEICITRITAAIRETGSIQRHSGALVGLWESCLEHNLTPQGEHTEDTPHAKIASDITSCILQNYSCPSVMVLAVPVAVRFLQRGNRELSRNMSSYLSLAAIAQADLLAEHTAAIIRSVLEGEHMLLRVLPSVYPRHPDSVHRDLGDLAAMMPQLEPAEQHHMIRLIQLVAEQHPVMLSPQVPVLVDLLPVQSLTESLLVVLLQVSQASPSSLVSFLPALRTVGEKSPALLGHVVKIHSAVGIISQTHARSSLVYLVSLLGSTEHSPPPTLLLEIRALSDRYPSLLGGCGKDVFRMSNSFTSMARLLGRHLEETRPHCRREEQRGGGGGGGGGGTGSEGQLQLKIQAFVEKMATEKLEKEVEEKSPASLRRYSLSHVVVDERRELRFNRSKSLALHTGRSRSITSDPGEVEDGVEWVPEKFSSNTGPNQRPDDQEEPQRDDFVTIAAETETTSRELEEEDVSPEKDEETSDRLLVHLRSNMETIRTFCEDVLKQIPVPQQCVIEDTTQGCVAQLSFSCPLKGRYCLYTKSCFKLTSQQPHLWIQMMLLHLQSVSSIPLSSRDVCVQRLSSLWEKTQLRGAHSFLLAMTQNHTPHRKDLDCLQVQLQEERFFDLFGYSEQQGAWLCFMCNNPEKATAVNQEGRPLIEGKLKEKQVRWKFIKRWKTRYFTLAGNQLLFRRGKSKDEMDDLPIELSKVQSVKVVAKKRRDRGLPRAFEIFTDNKTYVLKAQDEKHTEEWLQCINVAVAQARERENREATTYL